MDALQFSEVGLEAWLMLAGGVVFGYLLKWLVSAPGRNKSADNAEPGLAIQLEQTRMDADARATSDAARIKALQTELESLKSEAAAPSDVEELRSQLQEANQRAESLARRVEELESVVAASAGYAARIAEQDATIQTLHATLEERAREVGTLAARLETMESELASLRTQLDTTQGDRTAQNEAAAQLSELLAEKESENIRLTESIELQNQHKLQLESELDQIRTERDEAIAATVDLSRLSEQSESARQSWESERETLTAELERSRQESERMRDELQTMRADAEARERETIDQLTRRLAETEEELRVARESFETSLKESESRSRAEIDAIRADRDRLLASQDELSQKLATMLSGFGVIEVREQSPEPNGEANPPKLYIKAATRRDPLREISGIGPAFEERLYAAGITRFSQLAEVGKSRLREIVQAEEWESIDPDAWVAEARDRARGNLV